MMEANHHAMGDFNMVDDTTRNTGRLFIFGASMPSSFEGQTECITTLR